MERKKKKAAGGDVRGGGELRKFFEFCPLLATRFSLRLWVVRRRGGRCYASLRYGAYGGNVSPIKCQKHFPRVLPGFAARFVAYAFFMLISFFFSYLETFFVVFYLSFYFVLAQDASARDTPHSSHKEHKKQHECAKKKWATNMDSDMAMP